MISSNTRGECVTRKRPDLDLIFLRSQCYVGLCPFSSFSIYFFQLKSLFFSLLRHSLCFYFPLSLSLNPKFFLLFFFKTSLKSLCFSSQKENSDKKDFNWISGDAVVISKRRARDFVLNIIIFFGILEPIVEQHSLKTVSLKNEVRKLLIRFSFCLHCETIFYPFVSEIVD